MFEVTATPPAPLAGLAPMASCDAMRRLADAWRGVGPDDLVVVLDLPVAEDPRSTAWLARRRPLRGLG